MLAPDGGHVLAACSLELETRVREDFAIMEKAPTRAISYAHGFNSR